MKGNESMNGIVIYRSKYGAARKYAQWIAERTGFVLKDIVDVRQKDILEAENVVVGFGVYASQLPGVNFLSRNHKDLIGKRVFIYACGATPYDEDYVRTLHDNSLTGPLEPLPLFYMRGAFDINSMSFMDRQMCRMLIGAVRRKEPSDREPWEKALLEAGDRPKDWTSEEQLEELLEAIGIE